MSNSLMHTNNRVWKVDCQELSADNTRELIVRRQRSHHRRQQRPDFSGIHHFVCTADQPNICIATNFHIKKWTALDIVHEFLLNIEVVLFIAFIMWCCCIKDPRIILRLMPSLK